MEGMTFVLRAMRGTGRIDGHAADGIGHRARCGWRVMVAVMGIVLVRAVPVLRVHVVGVAFRHGLRSAFQRHARKGT